MRHFSTDSRENSAINHKVNSKRPEPFFNLQPKLSVNQPNDIYEQEADAMADKVMRMPDPAVGDNFFFKPASSFIQRKCAHCEEEEKTAQRKESNNDPIAASIQTEKYLNSVSGGNALSKKERSFFEPRMGYDFSNVKVHTDSIAAKSAKSINALAYTTGNNIVFNEGQYMPDTDNGKRLLGHELTHVVQQRSAIKLNVQRQQGSASFGAEVPQVLRKCSGCAEEEIQRMAAEEDEEKPVQRKSAGENEVDPKLENGLSNLGGGQPLPDSARSFFEPRFGQSFTDVRVHTGGAANRAARSINARAYTLGNNIAFASGEYNSSSFSGRSLIAHELTHTLQQSAGTKSVQRGSAGIFGGKGCVRAATVEWALVGAGVWKKLEKDQCTGTMEDADGMTCGGGFYHLDNGQTGVCKTPRTDDATFAPRRWTPTSAGASATSPTQEGSTAGDTPPGYVYDAAGPSTFQGCTTTQDPTIESARITALSKSNAAAAAMTALKGGTGTAAQQTALTAHFTALTATQFDTAKNRYDTISNRLRTPSFFACGSQPDQAYCGPPDNWCAGTPCPTTTGISYICPGAFGLNCAEPDLSSILLHESGRAAGCCPPDVMPTDAGYPPAAPACLTNVYCYSGFARAI